MNRERIEILMNRSLDGVASREEREELARALKADPLLKSEFDELASAHNSLNSLFTRLALPRDFSKRVMRRVQPAYVPAETPTASGRHLLQLPLRRRTPVATGRRQGRLVPLFATVGAVAAAAVVMLAIGLLTGVIGGTATPTSGNGSELQAEGSRGVPDVRRNHRTDRPDSRPDRDTSGDVIEKSPDVSPDLPKTGPAPLVRPDSPQPVPRTPEVRPEPRPDDPDPVTPEPENPEDPFFEPEPVEPPKHGHVDRPEQPQPEPVNPTTPRSREVRGTLTMISGKTQVQSAEGKWLDLAQGADIEAGANIRTSQSGVAIVRLSHGAVVLGRDTNVQLLEKAHRFALVKGEVTIERGRLHAGEDGAEDGALEAVFDGSTLRLAQGTTTIERGVNKKVEIHQVVGGCSILRGTETQELFNGQTVFVSTGKPLEKPVSRAYVMKDWAGNARTELVMSAVGELLVARNAKRAEADGLRDVLRRVLRLEVSSDLAALFLGSALQKDVNTMDGASRDCFKLAEMLVMMREVETAIAEQKNRPKEGLSYDGIVEYALDALENAETLPQWQDVFRRLRAGVSDDPERKTPGSKRSAFPNRPLPGSGGCGKCPGKSNKATATPPKKPSGQ